HWPYPHSNKLSRVGQAVKRAGGRADVVGGAVRDHLLGQVPKNMDIEVYQLSLAQLKGCLNEVNKMHTISRSFGVLKVVVKEENTREVLNITLPHKESKVAASHRDFVIESDPNMPFADAAARRDFTINAMGVDVNSGTLLDPHGDTS